MRESNARKGYWWHHVGVMRHAVPQSAETVLDVDKMALRGCSIPHISMASARGQKDIAAIRPFGDRDTSPRGHPRSNQGIRTKGRLRAGCSSVRRLLQATIMALRSILLSCCKYIGYLYARRHRYISKPQIPISPARLAIPEPALRLLAHFAMLTSRLG